MPDQIPLLEVDPHARRDEDFYRTPVWQTWALLNRIRFAQDGWTYFEPCAGDGAISEQLRAYVADVRTNDIVKRAPLEPDFMLDARSLPNWSRIQRDGLIDVVVTNPPFVDAFDIAQNALSFAEVGVALLLRLSWLEPTEERASWLADHPPTRLIVLPRYDYRQNGKTDSVTSAWMLWDLDGTFCAPGIEIVTKTERDRLVAKHGDR